MLYRPPSQCQESLLAGSDAMKMYAHRFVNLVGYYGIILNVTNLSGNIYVNFAVTAALEMLAYVVCLFALHHLGRKTIYVPCIVAGGVCCTLSILPVLLSAPGEYIVVSAICAALEVLSEIK